MKILFLGPAESPLIPWLEAQGESVVARQDKITEAPAEGGFEFLISYGYRFILREPVLRAFAAGRAINLHIAFLPWNRGADPNLWSWVEGTLKGVTIHHMDEGIDTGDIVAQRSIWKFGDDDLERETLATTYARLQEEVQSLFRASWPRIREGRAHSMKQYGQGSFHRAKDKERLAPVLAAQGWNTPVARLVNFRGSG
jgi:methionyl-tRNA formyltransferase